MHSLYFVKLPKDKAKNAEEAIMVAESFLEENSFAVQEGMWSGGKCDWYEVGGRWSGLFTEFQDWYKDFSKQVESLAKEKYGDMEDILNVHSYGKGGKKQERLLEFRKEIIALFDKAKPKDYTDILPLARHGTFSWATFQEQMKGLAIRHGNDDAVIITADIWKRLRKYLACGKKRSKKDILWGEVELVDTEAYEEDTVCSFTEKDVIGSWFVVIDYHS